MRRKALWGGLKVLSLSLILILTLTGCSLKGPRKHFWEFWKPKAPKSSTFYPVPDDMTSPPPLTDTASVPDVSPLPVDEPGVEAISPGAGIPEPPAVRQAATMEVPELPVLYFGFDQYDIRSQDVALLQQAVDWLKAHPDVHVQIEGHCDERGTREYNLNLGQRRANVVKEFLANNTVEPNRLHTISYGEERPVDVTGSEEGFALNRRVQFLVY
jgi:peptidoglycan-associated lipoprotein